jgi:ABC-type lipoprotein release transport system permease subunit
MNIWRLVVREIGYRKLNFGLALLSVAVAVGCLAAVLTVLGIHDVCTEELLAAREAETAQRMAKLEDDYRKITRNLGFNVLILHKDQNPAALYAEEAASHYLPEEYAERLAKSRIVTVNHLLPSLQERLVLTWQDRDGTVRQSMVHVIGVRGEVPILHQTQKKPLLDPVPAGSVVVGYQLHRDLGLKDGDRVRLELARRVRDGEQVRLEKLPPIELRVHRRYDQRGSEDDITIWVNLAEAQKLLGRPRQINAMLALECNCSDKNRLAGVRKEIEAILPDTQVIEKHSQALTRAEARNRAEKEALDGVRLEKERRAEERQRQEGLAAVLVPLALLGALVWLGVLAFSNVRDRSNEIGILRALGVQSPPIFVLFLARAGLIGVMGTLLGYAAGSVVGMLWGEQVAASDLVSVVLEPVQLVAVLLAAPLLCALASALPALLAVRQDPAVVLREG